MRRLLLFSALLSGCITLDALLPFHSGIPCTEIEASDCDVDDPWDAICDACEVYEEGPWWTRDYPWREKTLGSMSGIRPVETDIQHKDSLRKTIYFVRNPENQRLVSENIIFTTEN